MHQKTWPILAGIVIIVAALSVRTLHVRAQGWRRISPHEDVSATIDGATLTIEYGRPSMLGRQIFGWLVPYDVVWCPGADEATILESTHVLEIGSLRVPTGPHTIWILPTPEQFTFIVSKERSGFHTFYRSRSDLGRVEMRKRQLPSAVDQLTFAIDRSPGGGGIISMAWEKTEVSVPFKVVQ